MKKLTAGIFATILGVTAMGAADAAVTSKGYVDAAVGVVAGDVSALSQTVSSHATDIAGLKGADTTLQNNIDAVADDVDALETGKQDLLTTTNFVSDGTTGNVVTGFTVANGTVTYSKDTVATSQGLADLTTRVGTAEGAIDAIEADYLKAADKADLAGLISAADAKADAASTAAEGAVSTANSASAVAEQAKTAAEANAEDIAELVEADKAFELKANVSGAQKNVANGKYVLTMITDESGAVTGYGWELIDRDYAAGDVTE